MIRLIFITIFLFLLTGCTTVTPAVTEYKIALKTFEPSVVSSGCRDKSLKISQAFSSNSLMSLQMYYVQGNGKIYSYSQAKWNNSPNQEITSQTLKVLRDSEIFKYTQNSKSRSTSDLILEINIVDFMQYYNKDITESNANVVISLTLIEAKSNKVVASKTFSAREEVQALNASGGVKGLDIALDDVLNQGVEYLSEICK